jgi:diphthamide synthase (EF-2-diphthine--ammonia ligase)
LRGQEAVENSFAGRDFDAALLTDLPPEVDPCGERGEFHTCVYDGPMFTAPVNLEAGEIMDRDGFVYADFIDRRASRNEI